MSEANAETIDLNAVKRMWGRPLAGGAVAATWFCIPCQEWIKPGYAERHLKPNGVSCDPATEVELADSGEPRKAWRVIENTRGPVGAKRSPMRVRQQRKRTRHARRVNR